MTGIVSEWCLDWYDPDFYQISVDSNYCCNPINNNVPVGIAVKVLRGGNYTYPGAFAMSSHRFDTPPFVTTDHMGFRVVIREQLETNIETILPERFNLYQNYPNPFNPVTTLRYDLPEISPVNITIYDMLGRQVKTLMDQTQDAGYKSVIWNATNDYGNPVSAGIYLYQIHAGEYISIKKMVLLK